MSNNKVNPWREIHIIELNKLYPENTSLSKTEELIYKAGQRSIIKYIESQVHKGGVLHDTTVTA